MAEGTNSLASICPESSNPTGEDTASSFASTVSTTAVTSKEGVSCDEEVDDIDMRNFLLRWRFKGKLKLLLILFFTISVLFLFYQLLYYASLNQFQYEETEAHFQQHLLKKEIPLKTAVQKPLLKEDKLLEVVKSSQLGKPISGSVLGVAPEYWKYYSKQTLQFFCLSSKNRKISWDKVNDDYCDCPIDGSDEPSTSACMNGRFYCTKSSKTYAEYIPSSRVLDGICDCCDGSDEYLNPSACKITCK